MVSAQSGLTRQGEIGAAAEGKSRHADCRIWRADGKREEKRDGMSLSISGIRLLVRLQYDEEMEDSVKRARYFTLLDNCFRGASLMGRVRTGQDVDVSTMIRVVAPVSRINNSTVVDASMLFRNSLDLVLNLDLDLDLDSPI